MKYLLPCSCGLNVPIEVGQAGQTISCQCGQSLVVPTMREIRSLKPVPDEPRQASKSQQGTTSWSVTQRVLFVIGLAIAALGLVRVVYYEYNRSRLDTTEVADWDTHLDDDLSMLESMDLEDAWESWLLVRDSGIGPFKPPTYVRARMVSDFLKNVVFLSGAIFAFGALLMGIAFFLPKNKKK